MSVQVKREILSDTETLTTDTKSGTVLQDFKQWIFWLFVLGLTALSDNISVYIGSSPKEREKEEKG